MANMTQQRPRPVRAARPERAGPHHAGRQPRPVIVFTAVALVLLAALIYADGLGDRRLGPGPGSGRHRPDHDRADRSRSAPTAAG